MAPRKRKIKDGEEDQAKAQAQETSRRRVTRSMSRQPDAMSSQLTQPNEKKPKAKGKAKASANEKEGSISVEEEDEDGAEADAAPEDLTVADDVSHNKAIVVEHCQEEVALKYETKVARSS